MKQTAPSTEKSLSLNPNNGNGSIPPRVARSKVKTTLPPLPAKVDTSLPKRVKTRTKNGANEFEYFEGILPVELVNASQSLTVAIAAGFVKEAQNFKNFNELLTTTRDQPKAKKFRPSQAEALLGQAQELLDRLQRERSQYNDLRLKALETRLQIFTEARELQEINRRLQPSDPVPIYMMLQRAAEIENTALARAKEEFLGIPRDPNATWQNVFGWLENGQVAAQNSHNGISTASFISERFRTFLEKRTRDEMQPAQAVRTTLAMEDAKRFASTAAYLGAVADIKASALSPGGPLDVQGRVDALATQIQIDFDDVYARLVSVNQGIEEYFGYIGQKLPDKSGELEPLILWTRRVVSWMVAFAHTDQAAIISLQLSGLVPKTWKADLKTLNEGEQASFEFAWDGSDLDDFGLVRLTGVSITLEGAEDVLAEAIFLPPALARAQDLDGKWRDVIRQPMDPCRIGRIESRLISRTPELCGTVSLRNASPISAKKGQGRTFQLMLKKLSGGNITNVNIELAVNVKTKND